MRALLKTVLFAGLVVQLVTCIPPASASELEGPARFCGYSPIIDLLPGEKVTTLEGGIHEGRFRWDGSFGSLDVVGIGWASEPKGQITRPLGDLPAMFAPRRVHGRYVVAIWNGASGAAYFSSQRRITPAQLDAIGRVKLYNEGERPSGCRLRTVFVWE
jgi:hypothetical protein